MNIQTHQIQINSLDIYDIHDLTQQILDWIKNSSLQTGILNLTIQHTSAALCINEYEPGIIKDIQNRLEKFNPKKKYYEHNQSHICKNEMCFNGHSHCNALFLPTTISLQIINGQLQLGTWQRIIFIELDRARERTISLMYIGE